MQLRRATDADAQAIARVHVDGWRFAYRGLMPDAVLDELDVDERAGKWRERLASGSIVWVACAPDVVGFASMKASELAALYLDPAWVGRGVGRALVEKATEGLSDVTLWVLATNTRGIRFYEKLGFRLDGRRDDPFGEHLRYRR